MTIDVFVGLIVILYAAINLFGTLALVSNDNPRRALGWAIYALFIAVWLTPETVFPGPLISTLHRWSWLLFAFGASVYLGMLGWEKLRRELLVPPAFGYSLAGLFASLIPFVLMLLLPRQLKIIPGLTAMVAFPGVIAGGAWIVKKRPWILSNELYTSSLALFFSVMWLLAGFFDAYDYARRGWRAF